MSVSMEWQKAMPHGASIDGEYCVVESSALPLYLQYSLGEKHQLFETMTLPLPLVEELLDRMHEYFSLPAPSTTLEDYIQSYYEARSCDPSTSFKKQKRVRRTGGAVADVWRQLLECDVCVLPSVLLMNKSHTANKWSGRQSQWGAGPTGDTGQARLTRYPAAAMTPYWQVRSAQGVAEASPAHHLSIHRRGEADGE